MRRYTCLFSSARRRGSLTKTEKGIMKRSFMVSCVLSTNRSRSGFLPKIFAKWNDKATSHLVTIITFARIHYTDEEVEYLSRNDLDDGLIKDYSGRWCKDFFRVIIDFERRSDWNLSLAEIKKRLERSEREILLDYHMNLLAQRHPDSTEMKRILGKWSFVGGHRI